MNPQSPSQIQPQPPSQPVARVRGMQEFTALWEHNASRGGIRLKLADENRTKFYHPIVKKPPTEKQKQRELARVEFLCQRDVQSIPVASRPSTKIMKSKTMGRRQLAIENRLLRPFRESEHATNQLFEKVRIIKAERSANKPTRVSRTPRGMCSAGDDEDPELDDDFFDSSISKISAGERISIAKDRRSTMLAVADAERLEKYQLKLEQTEMKMRRLTLQKAKEAKPSPAAVWKSIFLTLLLVNRMRMYINLRKVDKHSVAAQFRAMLTIRNVWIRSRTRRRLKEKQNAPDSGLIRLEVPVDLDEFGNNTVVPQVTDNLYNVFQYFSVEMREAANKSYTARRDAANMIISFTKLVGGTSGTRGAIKAYVRKIRNLQRRIKSHLKTTQARINVIYSLFDHITAMLPVHTHLVAAGRGMDKLPDNSKMAAIERSSLELYCKTNESLLSVRGMLSASCHHYIRNNLSRVQSYLNNKAIVNLTVKRLVVGQFLTELRRDYLRQREDRLRSEIANYKVPGVTHEEAAAYLKGNDPNMDPVLIKLLGAIGPSELLHDDSITSSSTNHTVNISIERSRRGGHLGKNKQEGDGYDYVDPYTSGVRNRNTVRENKTNHSVVCNALRKYEAMIRSRKEKQFLLFSAVKNPELLIETMVRTVEKTIEYNKQEQHRLQLIQLEQYQQQQLLQLQREEEAKAAERARALQAVQV